VPVNAKQVLGTYNQSDITLRNCANSAAVPVDHYENFPVASILLPRPVRRPIESIYAFARTADDVADEGDFSDDERLARLSNYQAELDAIDAGGASNDPLFVELALNVRTHKLSVPLLRDLLDAFKQDVIKVRYANYDELLNYCQRSANPIGRLLLHLFAVGDDRSHKMSDQICTALQLINHWQDVAIDWQKNGSGRVYLPQDEMQQFGISDDDIARGVATPAWRALMSFQVGRTRHLLLQGAPLAASMPGRFGLELRLIVAGGMTILDKIDAAKGDIFGQCPTVGRLDWLWIFCKVATATLMKRK